MSGVFGFLSKKSDRKMSEQYIRALTVWNKMYGADGFDTYSDDTYGTGCYLQHLSNKVPTGQPIYRDEKIVAVIDAVIYNREEICEILNRTNVSEFSDEMLLLELIKQHGFDSLAHVNGDFAGAVYDEEEKSWTLFRDHMGIRPLFYYIDKSVFAFSTDMRGILAVPGVDMQINEKKLYLHMMGYNELSLCDTDFSEIHCIRPASYRKITESADGFDEKETIYWKLKQKKIRMKTDEEYIKEFRRLIMDSVKRRTEAVSGIIGAELSGGLDSSVIAILINRLGREGRYFSWSLAPEKLPLQEGADERKIIFDVCKQENITCEFTDVSKKESADALFEQVAPPYVNTANLSDGSAYLSSQGAKVVFTGHGGDEGVSHRSCPFELWYHKEYLAVIKLFWAGTKGQKLRIARMIKRMVQYRVKEYPQYLEPYQNHVIHTNEFLNDEFKNQMKDIDIPLLYFSIDPALYFEQGGPRIRLDNVAYHGAKYGVRYMIPFLDYRVFDFAVSIPRRMYLQKGMNRYIYREAFKDIMPESLYNMRYKDTASQRNYKFEPDVREKFMKRKEKIVGMLDKEYWKKYLDFEAIGQFTLKENFTKADYTQAIFKLHDLTVCCMIQNVKANAAKRCEEYEK